MQEIMNRIKARAIELLSDGTVARVIGWEKGETETDWSPALFETAEEMENFVYGDYAGANLSKYCRKFNAAEGKTLVVLHGDCVDEANRMAEMLRTKLPAVKEIRVQMIGPVIGAHCGPGTLACCFMGKERAN